MTELANILESAPAHLPALLWTQFWQVTLVSLLAIFGMRLLSRHWVQLAGLLWVVVLLKCLTPPLWHGPVAAFSWLQPAVNRMESQPASVALSPPATASGFSEPRISLLPESSSQPQRSGELPLHNRRCGCSTSNPAGDSEQIEPVRIHLAGHGSSCAVGQWSAIYPVLAAAATQFLSTRWVRAIGGQARQTAGTEINAVGSVNKAGCWPRSCRVPPPHNCVAGIDSPASWHRPPGTHPGP